MIIDKFVQIKITSSNLNHFKNIKYNFNVGDIIRVKPTELMINCKIKIHAKCDICGSISKIEYRSYLKNIKKYPLYCCSTSCSKFKENETKKEKYGNNYEKLRVNKMKKTNKERYGNENSSEIFRNEKNQDIFIKELKNIYKNEDFDYSKVNYINNYSKVEIICKKHGSFKIRPNALIINRGCKQCNQEHLKEKKYNEYIKRCNEIHSNKYDYSKTSFNITSDNITIICPIHGEFNQKLSYHMSGRGCSKCAKMNKRLNKIKEIENNLKNGYQLTPCFNKKACDIFDEISKNNNIYIQHAMNEGEFHIKELGYWVDGYDKLNNIVYEYDEKEHFKKGKLKQKDIDRQNEIIKFLNCKFIRIKEKPNN